MTSTYRLEAGSGGPNAALVTLLRQLMERSLADAVLVPCRLPHGTGIAQTLVTGPAMLERADPLAPVMPVNSARILSAMTKVEASHRKVAAVLRPCELRALVELVKLKQARLDNLLLIGTDCLGTYPMSGYDEMLKQGVSPLGRVMASRLNGRDDPALREACRTCEYPYPLVADIVVGLWRQDANGPVLLIGKTPQGDDVLASLGLAATDRSEAREEALAETIAQRVEARDALFKTTLEESYGHEKLLATLSTCINCHNCRDACPICYCRECIFDSPTFQWEGDRYTNWASRRGALRMPTDTLLFHLTRMNHMATSCVGCGLCSEACPNDIPVSRLFRLVGFRTQAALDYVPGRSLDDELPLTTFREDEFQELGQ